ncbi:Mitotic checkpoint serine/threonine-protein kinase BUB1 [Oryzias melastigma]|uniref:Mitotic checkpoint serine/threonine-protein kinase BUB1 n=1 Tax=Oryzias melastigma TaxID=30732 RepID=A0A834C8Q0_ORYME|nr:Mitotic checkpoint serine/threonine-protein kinase BUB1 [Oryzias melastigma]
MHVLVFLSYVCRSFESKLGSYVGDDPLDPWIKFVDFLEQRLPAGDSSEMCLVFDSLVQRFLNNKQYSNDIRYVNYCIKCASYYRDPITFYSHIFSKGIGTRTAALYVAWAQQFEQRGLNEQADAVYRKALENQAQPASSVYHEYSLFNSRTAAQPPPTGIQNPLQNRTNQMSSHKEPVEPNKMTSDCPLNPPSHRMTIIVSRSETSGSVPSSQSSGVQTVSEYIKDELVCDGSELSFEEVRAKKYFWKLKEKKREEENKLMERQLKEQEERIRMMKLCLEEVEDMEACGGLTDQLFWSTPLPDAGWGSTGPDGVAETSVAPLQSGLPSSLCAADADTPVQPSCSHTCGASEHSATHCDGGHPAKSEENLDVSQGGVANLSHTTPNTSLGFVQATPSRGLPSPTVNTREALGVIMGMFQAPTLLEESVSESSHLNVTERDLEGGASGGRSLWSKPPEGAPFTIFQDQEEDKENFHLAEVSANRKAGRRLAEVAAPKADKPNDTSQYLMSDESTVWGARFNPLNSLAACPNNTSDFALLAHCVSTPFTHKPLSSFSEEQENICNEDDASIRRQTKRLSPIIEQSPDEDKASESAVSLLDPSCARQGTIVSAGLTSITVVQPPPPAALSFRDQTLAPTDSSRRSGRGWEVHTSPEQPPKAACSGSVRPKTRPFKILEDASSSSDLNPVCGVPMSPECALQPGRFSTRSPEVPTEPDLDAFLSPPRPAAPTRIADVPMSPELPPLCADVPMSPPQQSLVCAADEPMKSPERELRADVGVHVVPDPWDDQLIARLLSSLSPPLTSHQRCFTWSCSVPNICPKVTISMGKTSLRVDCVLGEGAFATVYQATDLTTSEKFVLKVQKPANPWEFYINTQLDARLQPSLRQLYSNISSAHLFLNGSVLLGEFYSCGTLLNAVNIYKSLGEKVMPQPLVLYFTACILHMVEQLHRIHLLHADIKPDNFMLGGRFLENKCFDPESGDHGVVLIDLGQSIDMELFPEGTAFTAKCLTSGFQCTEMQSGKPWSYQTDYYGIAGTVHCMLFGNYMQVTNENGVWKTNGVFRRKPHSDLWLDFFHTLLNVPGYRSPPSLTRLRRQLTAVLQENYGNKLQALKNQLVIQLLERRRSSNR